MQRPNEQQQRLSSWAINYHIVEVAMKQETVFFLWKSQSSILNLKLKKTAGLVHGGYLYRNVILHLHTSSEKSNLHGIFPFHILLSGTQ